MAADSNCGVVSVVTQPSLKNVNQPSLNKFETEYSAYKANLNDVNKGRDDENKMQVAKIKDFIETSTLHALCIMRQIEVSEFFEQATVDAVEAWFESAPPVALKDLSERIDTALLSVTHVENKEDPAVGVTYFIVKQIHGL